MNKYESTRPAMNRLEDALPLFYRHIPIMPKSALPYSARYQPGLKVIPLKLFSQKVLR